MLACVGWGGDERETERKEQEIQNKWQDNSAAHSGPLRSFYNTLRNVLNECLYNQYLPTKKRTRSYCETVEFLHFTKVESVVKHILFVK